MRRTALLLGIGCALTLAGCDQMGGGDKRVAELEKKVAAMDARDRDLRTKMAARQAITGDPLGDFFKAPEFWQCTYDSGWSDCASRCTKATSEGYKACLANHPVGPKRQACVDENSRRGSACLQNCPVPDVNSGLSTCFM